VIHVSNWIDRRKRRNTIVRSPDHLSKKQMLAETTFAHIYPSFGCGFDSHRPLQILKNLRRYAIFHIFQITNFIAKPHGSCLGGYLRVSEFFT
jgi:hypothetical protein